MIKKDNYVFEFESTGRNLRTGGDGISITEEGEVRYGYDGYIELMGEDGLPAWDLDFTDEEKKELALYVIGKWMKWAGLPNSK